MRIQALLLFPALLVVGLLPWGASAGDPPPIPVPQDVRDLVALHSSYRPSSDVAYRWIANSRSTVVEGIERRSDGTVRPHRLDRTRREGATFTSGTLVLSYQRLTWDPRLETSGQEDPWTDALVENDFMLLDLNVSAGSGTVYLKQGWDAKDWERVSTDAYIDSLPRYDQIPFHLFTWADSLEDVVIRRANSHRFVPVAWEVGPPSAGGELTICGVQLGLPYPNDFTYYLDPTAGYQVSRRERRSNGSLISQSEATYQAVDGKFFPRTYIEYNCYYGPDDGVSYAMEVDIELLPVDRGKKVPPSLTDIGLSLDWFPEEIVELVVRDSTGKLGSVLLAKKDALSESSLVAEVKRQLAAGSLVMLPRSAN